MSNQTATLTTGPDNVDFTGGDNTIYAADGTLSPGDQIDAGTGPNDILYLVGTGTFDLTAPASLTGIQIVDGDANDDQTIILRAGLPVTVNLGGGNDTVTIANTGDVVQGSTGSATIYATTDLLGATIDGGSAGYGQLVIGDGTATSATLGSNVTNFHYIQLNTSNFSLNLGSVDAPVTYIDGDGTTPTNDGVTMNFAGQTVVDYTGGNTIDFAGGNETLTQEYVADGTSQPADTLLDFNATDTIDLPSVNYDDPNLDVEAYLSAPDTLTVSIYNETTYAETTQTYNLNGLFVGGNGFQAQTDDNGGTEIVYSGAVFTTPANPTPTQTIYWVPPAGSDGGDLIESDGTEAGTSVLFAAANTLQAAGFTTTNNAGSDRTDVVAGGQLYLLQTGLQGLTDSAAVYVSDGTAAGTTLLVDLGAQQAIADNSLGSVGASDLAFLTVQHTGTVSNAQSGAFDTEYTVTLWVSDGTAAGTGELTSFASTDGESSPAAMYDGTSQGQYYFTVTVGAGDDQLWATNATGTAATELADLGVGQQPTDFHTVASGGIWWSQNGNLYHSDGTAAGTNEDIASGPYTGDLVVEGVVGTYNGAAVFAFGYYGTGNTVYLGTYDGRTFNTLGAFDNSSVEVGYDAAIQVGSNLVLSVADTDTLYVSNGTSTLTAVTPGGLPGGATFSPFDLATVGNSAFFDGKLYFFGYLDEGGTLGAALFSTDGTAAGTVLVDDLQMQTTYVGQLTAVDGALYFTAMLGGATYLMRSDGTDPSYPVSTDGNAAFYDPGGLITGPLTPDSPAPAPQTYTLTTGPDTLIGTPYNDTFIATDGTLSDGDVIEGGGGLDTLILSGAGNFDLSAPATLTGISEVDAQLGGVSGSTQTITLRAGTDMIVRISGSSTAYTVYGADNSDTIIGSSGQTFAGAYTTTVTVGGVGETINVDHAIVMTSSANADALIVDPSQLILTDDTLPIVLNPNDQLPSTHVVLDGASTLSVGGSGNFAFDNYVYIYESTGGNTISLGDNGTFTIYAAGSGGDTINEAYTQANYYLIGTSAELNDDTINDFDVSHVVSYIDITDMDYATATKSYSGDVLEVTDGTHTDYFTIAIAGATTATFRLSYDYTYGGTIVTATCYAAGSRILTPSGEVAVETLRPGDLVTTASGAARPVRWLGRRRIDLARHPQPALVQPIRIRAGAVADGVPHRDLLVSPDHALFIDGALIPARLLVNGASIAPETRCNAVEYFHVELDSHDLLLAEGLAAESYLDTGNRATFENGGACMTLHPDLSGMALAVAPDLVAPRWRALAARAGVSAPDSATEAAPDLHIVAEGRTVAPVQIIDGRYVFALPRGCETMRLVSRAASPADLAPWHDDRRVLGVCVTRLVLHGAAGVQEIAIDDPALDGAFWPAERDAMQIRRWTDGDAALRVPPGTRLLEVTLAGTVPYPVRLAA